MKELKFIHITKCGGTSIEDIGNKLGIKWGRFNEEEYGWWHSLLSKKNKSLKQKYDWFMVVRNPYERIISEFYCNWGGPAEKDISQNEFNIYIKNRILNIDKSRGDHYTPAYLYLDEEAIIHILYFENLYEQFNNLMKKYNLNMKLDIHSNKPGIEKKFTIESLSDENIELINRVYDKDFTIFNYKKI